MQDNGVGQKRTNAAGSAFIQSPYLNFDPKILNPTGSSQFIIPEGQDEHRGKMEMAFWKIGLSVSIGGLLGGLNGTWQGMSETKNLSGKVRYSHLYDTMLFYGRGVDDELNIAGAGLLTGLTYTAPHGLPMRMAKGGAVGLGLSLVYLAFTRKDSLVAMVSSSTRP